MNLIGIDKSFGAVHANRNVSLKIAKGTIHGIVGENGAGKSTLMSILYGFYEADRGEIRINGKPHKDPQLEGRDRRRDRHGASALHAGRSLHRDRERHARRRKRHADPGQHPPRRAAEIQRLERDYGLKVDPDAITGDLPVGEQQRVEILKALYRHCDILILDEPTGVLTPQETDQLFQILEALKSAASPSS